MYEDKTKILKETKELEKQINELIARFEAKFKKNWIDFTLIPIASIKNNIPYNVVKGAKIQFYINQ